MGRIGRSLLGAAMLAGLSVVPVVAAASIGGTAAFAATPVIVGSTGTSNVPYSDRVLGVSASGELYGQATPYGRSTTLYGLPADGSPVALTGVTATDYPIILSGDLVVGETTGGAEQWENLNGTGTGTGPTIPPAQQSTYTAEGSAYGTPSGWVVVAVKSVTQYQLLLVTTSGSVTVLGPGAPGTIQTTGPAGLLVDGSTQESYIPYAAPHTPVSAQVADYSNCTILTSDAACTTYGSPETEELVPLGGGSASTPISLPGDVGSATGTESYAAWVNQGVISYEPWSGGTQTTVSTGPSLPAVQLASDASGLVASGGLTSTTAGLATLTPPATTTTRLLAAKQHPPVEAVGLSLSPGRVSWVDDAPASGVAAGARPTWSRTLTNSGGTLTAGSTASLISTDASDFSFASVSGFRTLTDNQSGDLVLSSNATGVGTAKVIGTPTNCPICLAPIGRVSGPRVLWYNYANSTWHLYDTTTGAARSLSPSPIPNTANTGSGAAIWGNDLFWVANSGSTAGAVYVEDLSASTPTPELLAAAPAGSTGCYGLGPQEIMAGPGYVAWDTNCFTGSGSTTSVKYLSLSGGSAVSFPAPKQPVAISGAYALLEPRGTFGGSSADPVVLSAENLVTRAVTTVATTSGAVALDGSTAAWVTPAGGVDAEALPYVADPPRYLGDGRAPPAPTGGNWIAEWDSSASLTSCSVKITEASSTVATLPCNLTYAPLGDAHVTWNTTAVAAGSYTWTLSAANADGALESPTGTPLTLTGSIVVAS